MKTQPVLSPRLREAAQSLAQNLLASEPLLRYQQAKSRLEANTQAQALLGELSQCQANLRQDQASGEVRQADIEILRHLQSQIQANAVIMDYLVAQQQAVNFLREINDEISQLLGFNFAVLA
jgi:cell fate (sporulation/competence/biofilm development) regulator YlbF (YheA/YmcA/DUF963 family)